MPDLFKLNIYPGLLLSKSPLQYNFLVCQRSTLKVKKLKSSNQLWVKNILLIGNRLHEKYFKVTNSEQINKLTGFKILDRKY